MTEHDKEVMIYHYEPKRKIFLVSLHLENKPGALGNLTNLLAVRGMNMLEGYFGGMSVGSKATVTFFVETTNERMDAAWLKEFVESSVYASDVKVKAPVEGFLCDSLNFPLTWNNGDRAVLMRTEGLRAMLEAVKSGNPETGRKSIYEQGFTYGKAAWENLTSTHMPTSKEGFSEILKIYSATGWGIVDLMDLDVKQSRAKVTMMEGFECVGVRTGKPESNYIRGHLAGAFSAFFGQDVSAHEKKCLSKGDSSCEFEFSP